MMELFKDNTDVAFFSFFFFLFFEGKKVGRRAVLIKQNVTVILVTGVVSSFFIFLLRFLLDCVTARQYDCVPLVSLFSFFFPLIFLFLGWNKERKKTCALSVSCWVMLHQSLRQSFIRRQRPLYANFAFLAIYRQRAKRKKENKKENEKKKKTGVGMGS